MGEKLKAAIAREVRSKLLQFGSEKYLVFKLLLVLY